MPPRLRVRSLAQLADLKSSNTPSFVCSRCQYATAAAAADTALPSIPTDTQILTSSPLARRYSPTNPPSHRDPAYRKSQLLRSYVSLLQTTPLIILFQHNNLKALEWASIRRELAVALQKVDDAQPNKETNPPLSDGIKLTVIRTNIFEPALRITEYYKPAVASGDLPVSTELVSLDDEKLDPALTHALSRQAHVFSQQHKQAHPLTPLLTGPLAALTFPTVSPQHVRAALSILSPQSPVFASPTRRAQPGYHELAVQDGLKKLLMLGARIDGRIFDAEGVRWVGGIEGGMDGLRAQLVAMLQGVGAGVTTLLEGAGRGVWLTLEGRRRALEEESGTAGEKQE